MISVIIPAYNVEKYLEDCMRSVLSQSYADLEAIVVDDGSTDRTPGIARRYAEADPRVKVVTRPNGGLSAARNSGLKVAQGEWVTFVDSDDELLPDALARMLTVATEKGVDIVVAQHLRDKSELPDRIQSKVEIVDSRQAIIDLLYQRKMDHSAWGKLYRRTLFDGCDFTEGTWYEDLDFFYRIFSKIPNIAYLHAPVYYYRQVPTSFLNTFNTARFDVLTVTERLEEWAEKQPENILRAARDRRLSANFNILGLLSANRLLDEHSATARSCYGIIKKYRLSSLFNPNVRLKNKIGILVSYLGYGRLTAVLASRYSQPKQ